MKIFDEKGRRTSKAVNNNQAEDAVYKELSVKIEKEKEESVFRNIVWTLVKFFDLTLLCDPIYLNIMLGMSLAIFAELNFSILTPFILADFQLSTSQIATFLSLLSIADLVFRFFAPFIGEFLKKPPRIMYMLSLFCLATARYSKYNIPITIVVRLLRYDVEHVVTSFGAPCRHMYNIQCFHATHKNVI